MLRWFLIVWFLCPCPCSWVQAESRKEEPVVKPSCCHHGHDHEEKKDSDAPDEECPRCNGATAVPPGRITWEAANDSASGVWIPIPATLYDSDLCTLSFRSGFDDRGPTHEQRQSARGVRLTI